MTTVNKHKIDKRIFFVDHKTDKSSTFIMPGRHGYGVRFSSFDPNLLIVGTSQTYGKQGVGTVYLLKLLSNGDIICLKNFSWADGIFDVAWCQGNPDLFLSSAGDGSIQLWNINNLSLTRPLLCYKEHSEEASCVDWSKIDANTFISSSWDCTVKLWDSLYTKSLSTYHEHSHLVYNAKMSPHLSKTFASVSADGKLKIWIGNSSTAMATWNAHSSEALTCDWNPINQHILATGGSEGFIKVWDIRYFKDPLFAVLGGDTAVRRLRYSYHKRNLLASVSYDGSTKIWDFEQEQSLIENIGNHIDSAFGLDWNPFRSNQLVDCGWDSFVHVFVSGAV